MDDGVSRRKLFKAAGAAGAAGVLLPLTGAQGQAVPEAPPPRAPVETQPQAAPDAAPPPLRRFLNEAEATFLTAAVDRLIPRDEWPSASEAGVVDYIDGHLAGASGQGNRMYLIGPWAIGTPEQGYQLRLTPAELYRAGISEVERLLGEQQDGASFASLAADDQDSVLQSIEDGSLGEAAVPLPTFFETLLANTVEGYFCDPLYGGNRNMAGWRMIGFPGSYAQYVHEVGLHGIEFDRPPMSMAQSALNHHDHH